MSKSCHTKAGERGRNDGESILGGNLECGGSGGKKVGTFDEKYIK